jgi:hypothetical protein
MYIKEKNICFNFKSFKIEVLEKKRELIFYIFKIQFNRYNPEGEFFWQKFVLRTKDFFKIYLSLATVLPILVKNQDRDLSKRVEISLNFTPLLI